MIGHFICIRGLILPSFLRYRIWNLMVWYFLCLILFQTNFSFMFISFRVNMTGLNEIVLISITKCSRLIDMILLLHDNNSYIMLNPLSLLIILFDQWYKEVQTQVLPTYRVFSYIIQSLLHVYWKCTRAENNKRIKRNEEKVCVCVFGCWMVFFKSSYIIVMRCNYSDEM